MIRAIRVGIALGWTRTGPRRVGVLLGLGGLGHAGVAWAVRSSSRLGAPDAVLGLAFGFGLPLIAYGAVATALANTDLSNATWAAARLGLSRRGVAIGLSLSAFLTTLLVLMPGLLIGLGVAYGSLPGVVRDVFTSTGLVVLGAAAYVAVFTLASTAMKRGRARSLALFLDFLLGSGTSALALPFPRGHLSSLLGGEALATLSQRQSSSFLGGLAVAALLLALGRLRD